jgi:hypothetical protein
MGGRARLPRAVERVFWRSVAAGVSTGQAAASAGVSHTKGKGWFIQAGGMAPVSLVEPSGRYLSMAEREEIAVLRGRTVVAQPSERVRHWTRGTGQVQKGFRSAESAGIGPSTAPHRCSATAAMLRPDRSRAAFRRPGGSSRGRTAPTRVPPATRTTTRPSLQPRPT